MKRTVFVLLFICSLLDLKAQEANGHEDGKKRFGIGAYFSPEAAFRLLQNTDGSSEAGMMLGLRDEVEVPKFGQTAGICFIYPLSKHFAFESGIEHSNKGYQSNKSKLTFGDLVDPRIGFVYSADSTNLPTEAKFVYSFQYVGVPIKLNYIVGKKRCQFISSMGLTAEYLINAQSTFVKYYENGHKERNRANDGSNYNRFNLTPSLSLGISYRIKDQLSLRVMPTARFGVLPIIDAPISGYLYSWGTQLGCYMNL